MGQGAAGTTLPSKDARTVNANPCYLAHHAYHIPANFHVALRAQAKASGGRSSN